MYKIKLLSFVFIIIVFSDCNKEKLTSEEYQNWYNKNQESLNCSKTISEFTFKVKYLPNDILSLKSKNTNGTNFKDEIQKQSEMQCYVFRIELKNKNKDPMVFNVRDQVEYQKRVEYYSFLVKNDFCLVEGNDTLPCIMSHFERYYGSAPYINLMIGFENKNNVCDKTIIFNDIVFNNGIIKLTIKKEAIESIPELIN